MTLGGLVLMAGAALATRLAVGLGAARRRDLLCLLSLVALYALQTDAPPTAALITAISIGLIGAVWWIALRTTITPTPSPTEDEAAQMRLALALMVGIVAIFIVLKLPALWRALSALSSGKSAALIAWIGFSYIAFRLLHVLLDFRARRMAAVPPRDFLTYVLFFPTLPAGPIARIESFTKALDAPLERDQLAEGARRIAVGLLKKFVFADTLALIALNPTLAAQTEHTLALWVMLYAYALRLFFDFSGYVDIAIGIGLWAGVRLPENFAAPYLRTTITAFWNAWHITLSTWFRLYFFTPLSRTLLQGGVKARLLVIFIAQVSTMIVIGLWHGIALNFVLWGAWHGVGLWAHKVIVDRTRGWTAYVSERPLLKGMIAFAGWALTFQFVVVGWVFFALPDGALILKTLRGLVGIHG
ncbi:MAG TPA: MBOAT family O-acyltransferase [Aggregatilineales bacterium]|nr:MBOAT family protein [Anaerolineales bacterium]HRE47352.1 MBOAT family O-acyltransferase [Aggregatilineales bacterium]